MSELPPFDIPPTPESEHDTERAFWDGFIRSLNRLSDIMDAAPEEHDPIDLFAILDTMQHETVEDGLTLLYNYTTLLTVEPGQSSKLVHVEDFLAQYGFVEFEQETE